MKIFSWLRGYALEVKSNPDSLGVTPIINGALPEADAHLALPIINPASGLPTMDGIDGGDLAGNPFGVDSSPIYPVNDCSGIGSTSGFGGSGYSSLDF